MNKTLIAYYSILVIILVSWSDPENLPPIALRLGFLGLVLLPLYGKARQWFSEILFFFVILSGVNHAPSYMPGSGPYLFLAILAGAFMAKPTNSAKMSIPWSFFALFILITIVELITSFSFSVLSYSFLIIIVVSGYLLPRNLKSQIDVIELSFILISLILAIEYYLWGSQFSTTIMLGDKDFERLGWADPNYFTSCIGFGVIIAFSKLISGERKKNVKQNILCIITLFLSFIVILATASRGGILAISAAIVLITFFSEIRTSRKIFVIMVSLLFVYFAYGFGQMDFILSRFRADDGTAGARTLIWADKLKYFFSSDALHQIFGYGIMGGRTIGGTKVQGFHNDFLAFLVCYGITGMFLFIHMIMAPLFPLNMSNKAIIPYVAYLIIVCTSLEPFSASALMYFYFYIYILMLKKTNRSLKLVV